jgi:hypothetical protein
MTALGLRVATGRALEEGVGQVVQGNGLGEREQVPLLAVEMGLQGRTMGQELVAHPVQARQIQAAEVVVQQFPKATALLQPLVGRELAARLHHAPDNGPNGGAQLVTIEPQLHQLAIQPQPPQCLQRHMLGPHATRADDVHPCQVHPLVVALRRRGVLPHNHRAAAADNARRNLLGHRLPLRIQAVGDQIQLPPQQRLDALGQRRPLGARHLEVAPEIEHRVLAHARPRAYRLDQAVGVIGLARFPALDGGAADKHGRTLDPRPGSVNTPIEYYGTTLHRRPLSA